MAYRWRICRTITTRFSDVDLSSLSTTASPLSAMVPASSLVAQSENFFSLLFLFPCVIHYTVDGDVCHSSYSQVGLLWSRGRALLLRLLCGLQVEPFQNTRVSMRQPQGVEQDKTPTYSWPCNIFVHKTRQDITGGTGHNKKLTLTRQYKSGHDTFYKD